MSFKIIWWFIIVLALALGFSFGAIVFSPSDKEVKIIEKHEKVEIKWKTKYKKLIKKKRVIVPVKICTNDLTEFEEELKSCKKNMNNILKWCDPYCTEKLEECERLLQITREFSWEERYYL